VLHCHGAAGGCADSASSGAIGLPVGAILPPAPLPRLTALVAPVEAAPEVAPPAVDQPPRLFFS
jgi:hypothetical protein